MILIRKILVIPTAEGILKVMGLAGALKISPVDTVPICIHLPVCLYPRNVQLLINIRIETGEQVLHRSK